MTLRATVFVSHYAKQKISLSQKARDERSQQAGQSVSAGKYNHGPGEIKKKKKRKKHGERIKKIQINRVYLVRASNAKQRTSRSADGGVISPGHLHNSKSSKKGLAAISPGFFFFPPPLPAPARTFFPSSAVREYSITVPQIKYFNARSLAC